ncbi:MAG: 2-oxoacid:acceptor oxidoreductase subunit alpha [Smithellaceae bacterium]|nr:2-oxoacid:acceptor oxidoreductase subunit alpha [Smithellaceae bacterium]
MKKGRVKVMLGNHACAEAAILAGCRFYGGYPITPATEILEAMSRRLPLVDGLCLQMEDEIAALVAVVGASWGGTKAMTATSGPGFCLMQEAIGLAVSVEAPCVIVNVQRGGPASGQSTSTAQGDFYQARYGSNGDYSLIVLAPSSAQEMFDHTIQAFNLSERFRIPVIILADEVVGHIREKVFIPDPDQLQFVARKQPTMPMEEFIPFLPDDDGVPPMPAFNSGYKIPVISQAKSLNGNRGNAREAADFIRRIVAKVEDHIDDFAEVHTYGEPLAETAFVTFGSLCRAARSAVDMAREEGLALRSVEVKTIWPFPAKLLRQALAGAKRIVVAEMNLGMLRNEVERVIRQPEIPIELFSKIGGIYPQPQEFLRFLEENR